MPSWMGIALLVVAALFLARIARGAKCGGTGGFARAALLIGGLVLGGFVLSGHWNSRHVAARREAARRHVVDDVHRERSIRFGYDPPNGNFDRIDADDMRQYRAQVSRRARIAARGSDIAEAAAPTAEAKLASPAAPLTAEKPESPQPASSPSPPASPSPQTPSKPAPEKGKMTFDAGPLRVEIDTDEESGLPSAEELTRAATKIAARATVEAAKRFTQASGKAAKKTAEQLASAGSKAAKTQRTPAPNGPDAVGSYSTSGGASGGTGNASYVAESESTSSPAARSAHAADSYVEESPATASASKRPAWMDESLGMQGGVYRTKFFVGPFMRRQDCDQALPVELIAAARAVIDRHIGGSNRIPDDTLLPYLSQRIVKGEWEESRESETASIGETLYLYVLLEFDERSWRELGRMQHQREIEDRVAIVGVGAGWLMLLLGTVFGYLKLDTMTRGYYTGRLQLAAGAVILTLIGVAVVAVS